MLGEGSAEVAEDAERPDRGVGPEAGDGMAVPVTAPPRRGQGGGEGQRGDAVRGERGRGTDRCRGRTVAGSPDVEGQPIVVEQRGRREAPRRGRLQLGEWVAVDGRLLPRDEPGLGRDPFDVARDLRHGVTSGSGTSIDRRAGQQGRVAGEPPATRPEVGRRPRAPEQRLARSWRRRTAPPRRAPATSPTGDAAGWPRSSTRSGRGGRRRRSRGRRGRRLRRRPRRPGRARRCGTGSSGAGCPRRGRAAPNPW